MVSNTTIQTVVGKQVSSSTSVQAGHAGAWRAWVNRCLGFLLLLAGLLASVPARAQTCGLPGWDGPATVSGVINSYHGGSGSPGAGATSISVASATGLRTNARALRAGDMVLIMQMQDSSGSAAGLHEYAQVVAIAGTTLSLNRPLTNGYTQNMSTSAVQNWQVVWVPQYSALTITATVTADRWTSNTTTGVVSGGVVAFDVAGSLALNGTVSVAGMGFRGAYGQSGGNSYGGGTVTTANSNYTPTLPYGGQKGEGTQGTPPVVFQGTAIAATYLTLLGQGYTLGAGGQASVGNGGGAANDGSPSTGGNQYNAGGGGGGNSGAGGRGGNSWNSGGTTPDLNQGTNTQIGNVAGGFGGNAQTNSATRLVMGGGGGSGAANNATVADSVTTWPPTTSGVAANGAAGPVTSSGASGGGVALIRAGSVTGTGRVDASGYRAYNKNPTGDTDAAGGGGAGGAIFFTAGTGAGAGITLNASGGDGGSSNYYNHGPGGGGGGGYVVTSLTGATLNVAGGVSGTDACCGGTAGNGSPKAWNSAAGAGGATLTSGGSASGVQGGAACLPVINVTKSTLTPTLTSAPGATASYAINLSNSGGAAANVFILDARLPTGWAYTGATAPTFTYSPAPPPAANSAAAGAENTSAGTPGALPVSTVATANSATAVTLRAAGSAPGVTPTTGAVTPTFGSFYLPQNGSITVSFLVTIPVTATVGTYHNPAGVVFLDPTRVTTAARMLTPSTNANANRAAVNYSANTTYASGSATTVLGSNYSGLQGGPTGEDVQLVPDFSVTKTAPASATPGTTLTYTIVARNNGWAIGSQTYAVTQATDVSTANIPTLLASNPLTVTDTLPAGVTVGAAFTGTNWTCTGTGTQVCTLPNANAWPIARGTNFATITGVVTMTAVCTGAVPQTNTVTLSTGVGETLTANNTGTASTAVTCPLSANLQVAKTNNVASLVTSSTTTYTITVANLGPGAAGGTVLSDVPSAGLNCTSATCTGAGGAVCPAASMPFGSLTAGVSIPTFPSASTATFAVTCGVTATGS